MIQCPVCKKDFTPKVKRGRAQKTCSAKCGRESAKQKLFHSLGCETSKPDKPKRLVFQRLPGKSNDAS